MLAKPFNLCFLFENKLSNYEMVKVFLLAGATQTEAGAGEGCKFMKETDFCLNLRKRRALVYSNGWSRRRSKELEQLAWWISFRKLSKLNALGGKSSRESFHEALCIRCLHWPHFYIFSSSQHTKIRWTSFEVDIWIHNSLQESFHEKVSKRKVEIETTCEFRPGGWSFI